MGTNEPTGEGPSWSGPTVQRVALALLSLVYVIQAFPNPDRTALRIAMGVVTVVSAGLMEWGYRLPPVTAGASRWTWRGLFVVLFGLLAFAFSRGA